MTEIIILIAAAAAAVYLLRPLFRTSGSRRFLLLLLPVVLAAHGPTRAHAQQADVSIGLLLIAVDAQRDHVRVSEAWRVANTGPARELDLKIPLPPGALYLTYHRGLHHPVAFAGGFRDRLMLRPGVTEVIYSYALPAGRTLALTRAFPLRVERMEVVARGRGVRLSASRGQMGDPVAVGDELLPRWDVRGVGAGESFTVALRGVPISRPRFPAGAAGVFAALLACGFTAAAIARAPAKRR